MNRIGYGAICLLLAFNLQTALAEEDAHEQGGGLVFSAEQRTAAGIEVERVAARQLEESIRVPAEVVINAYRSARVTPRVQAQILRRHVQLGNLVAAGQPLVTLSSVAMAEAQGELIVADREWQRATSLGQKAIGERRYTEAQVARQQALAKVLAYGMQEAQADDLLQSGNAAQAVGEFDLLAPLAGTVLQDNFISGELIEPGRILFDISDESVLWVEARLAPAALSGIQVGAAGRVSANGIDWIEGHVVQLHHRLNETTRTQGIRIAVDNSADLLHPGQFAEVEIVTGPGGASLAVPNTALTLIQGNPTVFLLSDGKRFRPEIVEVGAVVGDWTVIRAGLEAGDEIAVSGVFHLKSMLLKSSIGDEH